MDVVNIEELPNFEPETKKKEERKQTSIIILLIPTEKGNVTVSRDSTEYMVQGGEKGRISHFSNLESAMQEVSKRLFDGKSSKRAEEGRTDVESLVRLVEEHKREMKEKFRL